MNDCEMCCDARDYLRERIAKEKGRAARPHRLQEGDIDYYEGLITGLQDVLYYIEGPTPEEIPKDLKDWIDSASYVELLRKVRWAPAGDPYFAGAVGDYFLDVLNEKKQEVGQAAHVQASKDIGWD